MADKDEDEKILQPVTDEGATEGETVVVDEEAAAAAAKAAEAQTGGDERLAQEDDEPEDQGVSDEVKAQRRKERKERKERERVARDRNRKELNYLRARNEELERRQSRTEQRVIYSEAASLDDRIAQVNQQLRVADEVIATSISQNKGEDAVEAQGIRDQLKENLRRLEGRKQQLAREAQPTREQPGRQEVERVDPELMRNAQAWMAKHPWYKADKSDDDSAVVSALDDRLAAEGYDPTSQEYWDELESRASKVLPHRFKPANGNGQGNGAARREDAGTSRGPAMANGARERTLRPGEVFVSADRKAALQDAGLWDDPKVRNRYLKQFEKYDREEAAKQV
jgi:hypothetical protein